MPKRPQKLPMLPGDRLRSLLNQQGLSQQEFADAIGVSRLTINQIITHRRAITAEVALRIARATNTLPRDWLTMQQEVDLAAAEHKIGKYVDQLPVVITKNRKPK